MYSSTLVAPSGATRQSTTPPRFQQIATRRLWLNAFVPLLLVLAVQALMYAMAGANNLPLQEETPFAPSPWLSLLACALIFPMWGVARWKTWSSGGEGRRESRWVVALIAWGLVHQALMVSAGAYAASLLNLASLLMVTATTWHVAKSSAEAAWWLTPSVLWALYTSFVSFAALALQ
ncbi:MAG: tryptophan-rich sensory protein [Moraxellaceae bacterium]|nr:tryptophan-rich sensory protein [Moraxellaceae bacterium]